MSRLLWLAAPLLLGACATTPAPKIFSQADQVAEGAAADEAKRYAPQAHAHAQALRKAADAAHADGDSARAQVLAEHSIAAHSHAFVLARLAKSDKRLAETRLALEKARQTLAKLDEQQREVAAAADALDLSVKVARDALPLTPNEPTTPEREQARLQAARSLAGQARLLCVSAWMLAAETGGLKEQLTALDALDGELAKTPKVTPIDRAMKARSDCLATLTEVRRPGSTKARAQGRQDALLAALSKRGGLNPFRDDRGVVITLRVPARGGQNDELVASLARIAKAHGDFPLLVVSHSGTERDRDRAGKQGTLLADALKKAGAPRVEVRSMGASQPVVPRKARGAKARNERIELVFVSPVT